MAKKRIIIGMTGASGAVYGLRLLELLKDLDYETHLVLSPSSETTIKLETGQNAAKVRALADKAHNVENIAASISSGSFRHQGMIIAPCSIKTCSEIATGVTSNLLSRAADVTLKQRRRLVLLVRETPLHTGHLETMAKVSSFGAVVFPPVPAFYTKPKSLDEMVDQTLARVLDLFDIELPQLKRWGGTNARAREE